MCYIVWINWPNSKVLLPIATINKKSFLIQREAREIEKDNIDKSIFIMVDLLLF